MSLSSIGLICPRYGSLLVVHCVWSKKFKKYFKISSIAKIWHWKLHLLETITCILFFCYPNRSDFLLSTDSTRNIVRNKEQKRKLSGSIEPSVSGADNHDNIDGLEQSEGSKPAKIR